MKSKKWDNNTTKTASTRVLFISTGRNSVLLTCVSNVKSNSKTAVGSVQNIAKHDIVKSLGLTQ